MPAGHSSVEVLWGFPILEVCVVGDDNERMFGPTQVVSPVGEGLHHGKQLSLVDVVVSFCWSEGSGIVCDGVELGFPLLVRGGISLASFLGEHCSDSVCGGVGLQVEASFEIGLDEDWFPAHEGLEHFKGLELGVPPVPDQ